MKHRCVCRRRWALLTLAVVLTAGAVGCTPAALQTGERVRNQALWTMPLDEFYVYSPELDNYAEQLQIAKCVRAQGRDWPVPWQNTDFPQAENVNTTGLRLFTLDIARQWGYRLAPPADPESARLWEEFATTADAFFPDAELDEILLHCTDEVRTVDAEFTTTFDGVNYLSGLALQAEEVVLQDPAVIEATAQWRDCLEPLVSFSLRSIRDPWTEMPPRYAATAWGATADGTGTPSAEEIAVAMADAECRDSSGLAGTKYERSWDEQQNLVDQNRDKLDRIREAAAERKAKLLTIVAENAPKAP